MQIYFRITMVGRREGLEVGRFSEGGRENRENNELFVF